MPGLIISLVACQSGGTSSKSAQMTDPNAIFLRVVRKQMPPTEPLAVFHLAEEGAFSEGLVQAARVPDDGRGFIVVLDDDLRTRQMRGYRA